MSMHYEDSDHAGAYTVDGWGQGIAWHVLGWETQPDADTEWSGYEVRTGNVVAVMVGDDRHFSIDPENIKPLAREDFCGECGQVGCTCDGYDRVAVPS